MQYTESVAYDSTNHDRLRFHTLGRGLLGLPMDTSSVLCGIPPALAEDLYMRTAVLVKPYVDLRTFTVILGLDPYPVRAFECAKRLGCTLTFDALGDLQIRVNTGRKMR